MGNAAVWHSTTTPRPQLPRAVATAPRHGIWLDAGNQGDRIRTCDILLPKQVLYQAELHPVGAHRAVGKCRPGGANYPKAETRRKNAGTIFRPGRRSPPAGRIRMELVWGVEPASGSGTLDQSGTSLKRRMRGFWPGSVTLERSTTITNRRATLGTSGSLMPRPLTSDSW